VTRNARGKGGASSFAGTSQEALELERKQRVATLGQPPNLQGNPPLVTVVIPCYNQAHFLGEAIESVLSQTYRNFEVIVVDDGSTDNTSEVASRYEGVRLIWQENRGLAGARNRGLEEAKGEYVVFLDADDRLLPGALEAGLGCFEAHPECALVAGHCRFIDVDGLLRAEPRPSQPIGSELYAALLERRYFVIPGTVMYRRAVIESVGAFDTSLKAAEDYDLYFRIAKMFPVYWHHEMVLEYRKHGASMTRKAGLMLQHTVVVLRRQWNYSKGDRRYREAFQVGLKSGREEYGYRLAEWVRDQMRERRWKEALGGAYLLARYHPRGLDLLVSGKRLLERRLEVREKELRGKEWQLKKLRKELQQQRRQLHERTQQLRRLRQRTRRLEEAHQELQRRLQEEEGLS
jgi:glycosyltransferase involved in cell wall biosynthesis